MENQNKTVLITGASSGIGLELTRLFSKDGFNLVIVSRNEERLNELAEEFEALGAGSVKIIAQDLSLPNGAQNVYSETVAANIKIDILVNDAGVGVYGLFTETELETELAIIQLNIGALVQLTKLFVKDMIDKGEGKILQLASIASYQPTPLLSVYAATKSFVLSFSDAIGQELKDTGVTVTTLIPNATETDFFNKAGMEHTKAANNDPEHPRVVAEIGYKALMNGEAHALAPGVAQAIAMSSILPNRTLAGLAEKNMQDAG